MGKYLPCYEFPHAEEGNWCKEPIQNPSAKDKKVKSFCSKCYFLLIYNYVEAMHNH